MKSQTKSSIVYLEKNLAIKVQGEYYSGSPRTMEYPGDDAEFNISDITMVKGGIIDLLLWAESQGRDALNEIERMAIENL